MSKKTQSDFHISAIRPRRLVWHCLQISALQKTCFKSVSEVKIVRVKEKLCLTPSDYTEENKQVQLKLENKHYLLDYFLFSKMHTETLEGSVNKNIKNSALTHSYTGCKKEHSQKLRNYSSKCSSSIPLPLHFIYVLFYNCHCVLSHV